jgi:hypothetical protein
MRRASLVLRITRKLEMSKYASQLSSSKVLVRILQMMNIICHTSSHKETERVLQLKSKADQRAARWIEVSGSL